MRGSKFRGRNKKIPKFASEILSEKNKLMKSREICNVMLERYNVKELGLNSEVIALTLKKFPENFKYHVKVYPSGSKGVGKWEYIGDTNQWDDER